MSKLGPREAQVYKVLVAAQAMDDQLQGGLTYWEVAKVVSKHWPEMTERGAAVTLGSLKKKKLVKAKRLYDDTPSHQAPDGTLHYKYTNLWAIPKPPRPKVGKVEQPSLF